VLGAAAHLAGKVFDGHLEAASWLRLQGVLLLLLLHLQLQCDSRSKGIMHSSWQALVQHRWLDGCFVEHAKVARIGDAATSEPSASQKPAQAAAAAAPVTWPASNPAAEFSVFWSLEGAPAAAVIAGRLLLLACRMTVLHSCVLQWCCSTLQ
jgi:hypothetical protein